MNDFDVIRITVTPSEFNSNNAQIFVTQNGKWIEQYLSVRNYEKVVSDMVKDYTRIYPENKIILKNLMRN